MQVLTYDYLFREQHWIAFRNGNEELHTYTIYVKAFFTLSSSPDMTISDNALISPLIVDLL